jgi:hypothetical protein
VDEEGHGEVSAVEIEAGNLVAAIPEHVCERDIIYRFDAKHFFRAKMPVVWLPPHRQ